MLKVISLTVDRLVILREIRKIDLELGELNYHNLPIRNSLRRLHIIYLLARRRYFTQKIEALIA